MTEDFDPELRVYSAVDGFNPLRRVEKEDWPRVAVLSTAPVRDRPGERWGEIAGVGRVHLRLRADTANAALRRVAIVHCPPNGSQYAWALEVLASLSIETVIGLGHCESMVEGKPGRLYVPHQALVTNALTAAYKDPPAPTIGDWPVDWGNGPSAAPWLAAELMAAFDLPPRQPRLWSDEGWFLATHGDLKHARRKGIQIMDGVVGLGMHVAARLGLAYAALVGTVGLPLPFDKVLELAGNLVPEDE